MTLSKLTIEHSGIPHSAGARILLDDEELKGCTRLVLTLDPSGPPKVEMNCDVLANICPSIEAEVHLRERDLNEISALAGRIGRAVSVIKENENSSQPFRWMVNDLFDALGFDAEGNPKPVNDTEQV